MQVFAGWGYLMTDENGDALRVDCIVIGAGIAGASVAAELSGDLSVALIERESQPGYHTTGRSAALFTEAYGPPVIRALSRASAAFFHAPREGGAFLHPRGVVFVARPDQAEAEEALRAELGDAVRPFSTAELARTVPLLRPGYAARALYDDSARDIDVHALHQHYLRRFRAAGGTLWTGAELTALEHSGDWVARTARGDLRAPIVVNAAGAWADEVAALAGVPRRGLMPKRRTALIVKAPDGAVVDGWPMVADVEEQWYVKPDAGRLLMSPADEEPSPPCDAQPEELQVAICVDRIERAFDLPVRRIENKWAGLRSFFSNGRPLVRYEPGAPGFFWLAGQGGYGIQTAPALARTAAALVRGRPLPGDIADQGVTAAALGGSAGETAGPGAP